MDSVFSWAVATIAGLIFVFWFLSKLPAPDDKPVYLKNKSTAEIIAEHYKRKWF